MIKCLIVDDEQLARELIQSFANRINELKVVGQCRDTFEAEKFLAENRVDLVFMDIEMPGRRGTQFLEQQEKAPKVIFTTAYSEYAVKGFDLDAVDYLLKPISFQRFNRAVDKARKAMGLIVEGAANVPAQFLWVKEGYKLQKIMLHDIVYIESMREYIAYHTNKGRILELKALGKIIDELPSKDFIQIHRSYIVACRKITSIEKDKIMLNNDIQLPIGKTFRKKINIEQIKSSLA